MTAKISAQQGKQRVMAHRYAMTARLPGSVPHSIRCIRRKSAFTLIEVMVALLVITLGMGAVIVTTGVGLEVLASARIDHRQLGGLQRDCHVPRQTHLE